VLLVTAGVVITTLSAQSSSARKSSSIATYATGIGILTLALVLSGMLGLIQDWTFAKHALVKVEGPAPWQESMFYLHFLALPMFIPLLPDLVAQMHILNSQGSRVELNFPIPLPASLNLTTTVPALFPSYSLPKFPIHFFPHSGNKSLLSITETTNVNSTPLSHHSFLISLSIPHIYLPLVLNTITQLLCVAGVHRLTTRVSALTVTLVLVVRKAASLIISVIGVSQAVLALKNLLSFFGVNQNAFLHTLGTTFAGSGEVNPPQEVDNRMMWTGAALVLLGTIGYTIGSCPKQVKSEEKGKTE
jgi:UDP-xylose/UDP-N-acetylglucosamine transporter B4